MLDHNSQSELTQSPPISALPTYIVVIAVTIGAYVPTLLDPDLAELGPPDRLIVLGGGLLYMVLGTLGFNRLTHPEWERYLPLYFLVQLVLVTLILFAGAPVLGALWVLMLPVIAQALTLGWAGAIVVSAIALGAIALLSRLNGVAWDDIFQSLIGLAAAVVFTLVFTSIAIREQDARGEIQRLATELQGANRRLTEYAVQVEEMATVQERNRLAREIHDTLGHDLTAINMQLKAAQAVFERNPEQALAAVERAQRLAEDGLRDVRQSVAALRVSPLENRPLADAIGELVAETRASGIVVQFSVEGEARSLSAPTTLTLYRSAQEGLTNVRKHARASRVDIRLDYADDACVSLVVQDNGVGAREADGGFGLLGLRERVNLLGGKLHVVTAPGQGFQISISLPTVVVQPSEPEPAADPMEETQSA